MSSNRWCAVPQCTNTSRKTPNKLFVFVPFNKTTRAKWLELARRDVTGLLPYSHLYFCEDHFDLPNDMDNYMQYHLMGSVSQIRMKPGCIPSKFDCQPDGRKHTSDTTEQQYQCIPPAGSAMLEHGEQRTPIKQEPLDEDSEEPGVESVMLCCVKEEHSPEVKQELPQGSEELVGGYRVVDVQCDMPCVKTEHDRAGSQEVHAGGSPQGGCFACRHCGLCYLDRESLKRHAASHSPGTESGDKTREGCSDGTTDVDTLPRANRYPCTKCPKQFKSRSGIIRHVTSVHKGTRYPCHICRKSFTRVSSLQQHFAAFHQGRIKCPTCGRSFATGGSLKRHIASGHAGNRFKCVMCGEQYELQSKLSEHIQSTHNGTPFQCSICSKAFNTQNGLSFHVASIHNSFRFDCAMCGKEYKSKWAVKVHIESVHNNNGIECAKCRKKYSSIHYLNLHIASVHNRVGYACVTCRKEYASEQALQKHVLSAHDGTPFRCRDCSKTFVSQSGLWNHFSSIHKKARFECLICSSQSSRRDHLKTHISFVHKIEKHKLGDFIKRPPTKA